MDGLVGHKEQIPGLQGHRGRPAFYGLVVWVVVERGKVKGVGVIQSLCDQGKQIWVLRGVPSIN